MNSNEIFVIVHDVSGFDFVCSYRLSTEFTVGCRLILKVLMACIGIVTLICRLFENFMACIILLCLRSVVELRLVFYSYCYYYYDY